MTDEPAASTARTTLDRSADLILAGVHLRLGSLALARAELETLAGRDGLDDEGILDLAEVRWRTGDVEGAGEAAALVLEDEDGPLVALIVAAEAAAARGRPTEARRLAARALTAANGSIDRVFAGMPRSQVWPPDPAAPPPAPTTMFDPPQGRGSQRTREAKRQPPRHGPAVAEPASAGPESTAAAEIRHSDGTIGLWGEESESHTPTDAPLPSASDALDQGRAALESDDLAGASMQLALVLRLSTALAPAVLDLVADRPEPELAFVRGDAYRLVGRELDARRAYARIAGAPTSPEALPEPSPDHGVDQPQEGDPA